MSTPTVPNTNPPINQVIDQAPQHDDVDDEDENEEEEEENVETPEASGGAPNLTSQQIGQLMNQLMAPTPGPPTKPGYTPEQELRRQELIADIEAHFGDEVVAKILRAKTQIPCSHISLKRASLVKLEGYVLTMRSTLGGEFKVRPMKMLAHAVVPYIETMAMASPVISSRIDLSGLAEEFKVNEDIDLALRLMDIDLHHYLLKWLPGGAFGSLIVACGALGLGVDRRNRQNDALFGFFMKWQGFPPGTVIPEQFPDAQAYVQYLETDVMTRAAKKALIQQQIEQTAVQRNAAAAQAVNAQAAATTPGAPIRVPTIGASANISVAAPPSRPQQSAPQQPLSSISLHPPLGAGPPPSVARRGPPKPVEERKTPPIEEDVDLYGTPPIPVPSVVQTSPPAGTMSHVPIIGPRPTNWNPPTRDQQPSNTTHVGTVDHERERLGLNNKSK
jgi:hypothetical protein